jgi:hypothetical protein
MAMPLLLLPLPPTMLPPPRADMAAAMAKAKALMAVVMAKVRAAAVLVAALPLARVAAVAALVAALAKAKAAAAAALVAAPVAVKGAAAAVPVAPRKALAKAKAAVARVVQPVTTTMMTSDNYAFVTVPRLLGRDRDGVLCLLTYEAWRNSRLSKRLQLHSDQPRETLGKAA